MVSPANQFPDCRDSAAPHVCSSFTTVLIPLSCSLALCWFSARNVLCLLSSPADCFKSCSASLTLIYPGIAPGCLLPVLEPVWWRKPHMILDWNCELYPRLWLESGICQKRTMAWSFMTVELFVSLLSLDCVKTLCSYWDKLPLKDSADSASSPTLSCKFRFTKNLANAGLSGG